tara:strand:+ start:11520 stop:12293 length:774 start_codon:yes stop_codon:yes gene_type:complete
MGKILIDTQTEPATPSAGTLALYSDSANSNHFTQKDENGTVIDLTASIPTTTKGDVVVHNGTTNVRLGVGTDGQVITADSAQTEGIKWADATATTYPEYHYGADNLFIPDNSDWTVTAPAGIAQDSNNNSLLVGRFDNTTAEGLGTDPILVPSGATNIIIDLVSRPETAPGSAKQVMAVLNRRNVNSTVGSWSATDLTAIDITTDENWLTDSQTITLSSLGITAGEYYQIELSRDPVDAADDLEGDWALRNFTIRFS